MLLKLSLLLFSFSLLSSDVNEAKIKLVNESYVLMYQGRKIDISFNGKPEVKSVDSSHKSLVFIDYFSGDYGTHNIVKVFNRIVLSKKTNKKIVDFEYNYKNSNNDIKWVLDSDKRKISIFDNNKKVKVVGY